MTLNTVEHVASIETTTLNPLAPLTPAEIAKVVSIVKASPLFSGKTRFETIELLEPAKAAVRALKPGQNFRARRAPTSSAPTRSVWCA